MGIKVESDCLWPEAGIMPHKDVVFEVACRVLEVTNPSSTDPVLHCYGLFQLSYEALRAFDKAPGSFRAHLPDVQVHSIVIDPEIGMVTCLASCPRFAVLAFREAPPLYTFEFELGSDGSVASRVERAR